MMCCIQSTCKLLRCLLPIPPRPGPARVSGGTQAGHHPARPAAPPADLQREDGDAEAAGGQLVQVGQALQPVPVGRGQSAMDVTVLLEHFLTQ